MHQTLRRLLITSVLSFSFCSYADEEQIIDFFQSYCVQCHQGYNNIETIVANQNSIYQRLTWLRDLTPVVGSMPPAGTLREQLINEPTEPLAGLLDFLKPDPEPEPENIFDQKIAQLKLPPGFRIYRYAAIKSARSLTLSPSGYIFVGTGGFSNPDNKVYALKDKNNNGKIDTDEIRIVAEGLDNPNGVAYRNGDLFVAETQQIRKLSGVESWLQTSTASDRMPLTNEQILPQKFPSGPGHAWKFIRFAPAPNDHLLYIPVGSFRNVHQETEGYAAIFRIDVRGTAPRETVALGVRNTVGFDFHPDTGNLWFTDNGRDQLGDGFPPDELNEVSRLGEHFGFPYCHGPHNIGGQDKDPQFNQGRNCRSFTAPKVALDPHAAALGMRFYQGTQFPAKYHKQIFIAEHGSWNISPANPFKGYKVSLVTKAKETYSYEPLIQGWLEADGRTRWGRPVDIETLPDGSMLISDDGLRNGFNQGSIYRVVYEAP